MPIFLIFRVLEFIVVGVLFSFCLFSDFFLNLPPNPVEYIVAEVVNISQEANTQWKIVLCFSGYYLIFFVLHHSHLPNVKYLSFGNTNLWLNCFVMLALFCYMIAYREATHSTELPVLLGGCILGKALAEWAYSNN
jgi:hypothetical protein